MRQWIGRVWCSRVGHWWRRPSDNGWLQERYEWTRRYYDGEIDVRTFLDGLKRIAENERRREIPAKEVRQ